jgi:hypothetical protein
MILYSSIGIHSLEEDLHAFILTKNVLLAKDEKEQSSSTNTNLSIQIPLTSHGQNLRAAAPLTSFLVSFTMVLSQTLPHEIWIYIFSDCIKEDYHPYQSLHILESTCKHFQAMVSSSPLWSTAYAYTFKSIVPNNEPSIGWKLKLKDDIHLLGSVGSILCATRLDSEDSLRQCIQVLNKLWKVIRSNSAYKAAYAFEAFVNLSSITDLPCHQRWT